MKKITDLVANSADQDYIVMQANHGLDWSQTTNRLRANTIK